MNKNIFFSLILLLSTAPTVFYGAEANETTALTGKELDDKLEELAKMRNAQVSSFTELHNILAAHITELTGTIKNLEQSINTKLVHTELLKQSRADLTTLEKERDQKLKDFTKQINDLKALKGQEEKRFSDLIKGKRKEITSLEVKIQEIKQAIDDLEVLCRNQEGKSEEARLASLHALRELNATKTTRAAMKNLTAARAARILTNLVTVGLLGQDADALSVETSELKSPISEQYQLAILYKKASK